MDEAVMARLEQWFGESSRQMSAMRGDITALRDETARRFEQIDHRFEQIDRRFEQIDRRFEQIDREIASLREDTEQRFVQVSGEIAALGEETARRFDRNEEVARHTLILMEHLRDEFRLIGEAYLGLNDRVERYHSQSTLTFEQVAGWMQPHFRDMDRRLGTLEGWRNRQEGDVLDAVRRLLEKLSLQRTAKSPA